MSSLGVVFPAKQRFGLVQVVVLAWAWLEGRTHARRHLDAEQIGVRNIADSRLVVDEALADLDMQVAVQNADDTQEAVEAPDGDNGPEVALPVVVYKVDMTKRG